MTVDAKLDQIGNATAVDLSEFVGTALLRRPYLFADCSPLFKEGIGACAPAPTAGFSTPGRKRRNR